MEQNSNLTLFQRLSNAFGLGTPKTPDQATRYQYQYNSPIQNREIILKTDNKQVFDREKLERQQQSYLTAQWSKTDSELYRQAIYYETTRLASYYDFEAMEFTPEISAALDIFMEESTTPNDKGKILGIYSDSKRIKKVLENLFYNVLDINTNLPAWTRNTPIRENSMIPLLDGRTITIKELSDEIKSGKDVWTYSIQDNTHQVVPGKIIWCDLTRKNSELIRVTLDDNTYLDTTPDHEYMLRDGSYKRADQLTVGQSLMPFYTTTSIEHKDVIKGYEKIYNPAINKYQYTHRIVAKNCIIDFDFEQKTNKQFLTHHKNFNKKDNTPNNLERLSFVEHSILHERNSEHLSNFRNKPEAIAKGKTKKKVLNHKVISVVKLNETSDVYCMEVVGPNNEQDRHNFPVCTKDISGSFSRNGTFLSNCKYGDNFVYLKIDRERGIVGCTQLPNIEIERKEYHLDSIYRNIVNEKQPGIQFNWKNKDLTFQSWEIAHFRLVGDDRRLPYGTSILEKARRIWKQLLLAEDAMLIYRTSRAPERRVFKVFVGNMDDDDVEAYVQKVANKFKRSLVVDPKTGQVDTRYNQLAVDQDFFIPVRDPGAPNPIDTLPGAQNLAEIADVEYIQRKLFAAIRTPKAFLGFEDVAGDGKNLALKDIRFARTINHVQQTMIQELNKIAIIHLYVLGFEDEIDNFSLTLNNPSTQADLMKIEALKEKAMLYKDLVTDAGNGFQITSMTWAKKNIFGFSEDEIRLDLEQQRLEKAAANELSKTTEIIIHTGIFDNIDKIFGKRVDQEGQPSTAGSEGGEVGGGLGGELGGAEFPPPGEEAPPEEGNVETEGFVRKADDRPLLIENRISYDINKMLDSLDELIGKDINEDDELIGNDINEDDEQ